MQLNYWQYGRFTLISFFLVPQKCTQWNYIANEDDSLKKHLWNTHWRKATQLSAMRVYLNIETTSSNLRKHMMRKHVGEKPHNCRKHNYTSNTFSDALQIHMMTHTDEKPHKFQGPFGIWPVPKGYGIHSILSTYFAQAHSNRVLSFPNNIYRHTC